MTAKNLTFFLIIFLNIFISAQFSFTEKVLSSSDKAVIETIAKKYADYEDRSPKEYSNLIETFLKKHPIKNAQVREIVTEVFLARKTAKSHDKLNPVSEQYFEKALSSAKKIKRKDLEIWISLHYGYYYYYFRKYEKCFPIFMFCIKELDSGNDDTVIQASETYKKIAYFLTTTEDILKAEEYLNKARKYAEPNSSEMASIYNSLGFCKAKNKKYEEAEQYFNKTLEIARKSGDEVRYAKALGSLGELEIERKNFEKAFTLIKKDIEISSKNKSDQNTMYALTLLSDAYLKNGDIAQAKNYLQKAQEISQIKTYFRSSEYKITELKLKIAQLQGDDVTELQARRRLENLKDSLKDFDAKETVLRVGWESQKKQLQMNVEMEKAGHEKESYLKISAIVFSCMLIILMVFIIRSYRHKMRSKKGEYDKKVLTLMIDKIKSESKLNNTHKTIQSYQTYLSEKNKQIAELETEMQKIKNSSFSELEEKSGELQKLLESHLMTDENWKNFRNAFIQKYPTHYKELTNQFPDLTDSNLRIIILTKLNMNNTEISRLLGVTIDAVKKAKHRLRKKYENDHESLFEQI